MMQKAEVTWFQLWMTEEATKKLIVRIERYNKKYIDWKLGNTTKIEKKSLSPQC